VRYPSIEDLILEEVRLYAADRTNFRRMSTEVRIAVALVLDRQDLMEVAWGTVAESVHKLGIEWTEAAVNVQRESILPIRDRSFRRMETQERATPRSKERASGKEAQPPKKTTKP
jgi:hypothetical protein